MKYANELKVGVTIVVATITFVLGVRYFEDLPLFRGTYELVSEFDNAVGLIAGNVVRIKGVSVGSVDAVYIDPETGRVRIEFHVDDKIPVPEGSYTQISGFDALGVVRMDVHLGESTAPRIPDGGLVESREASNILGSLSEKAPALVDRVDSVLARLGFVLGETGSLLSEPDSDLRKTLSSVQSSVETLDSFLRAERDRLSGILGNVASITDDLNRLTSENADSIGSVITNLNAILTRLDRNLASLEAMSDNLTEVLRKVNDGEGTLGLLVNDPAMYRKIDTMLTNLNKLLLDFQSHPEKYLKELRLIDIF